MRLAHWLENQEEVANVLHPGLPSFGSHEQWRKDFTGSCGLFSIELKSVGDAAQDMLRAKIFCESLRLFRIGGSWGGVDSMVMIGAIKRTKRLWAGAPLIRLFAGLENVEDLRRDLSAGLRDRKSTRLNSSHQCASRMPSSAYKNT